MTMESLDMVGILRHAKRSGVSDNIEELRMCLTRLAPTLLMILIRACGISAA
jgi:hypothetical protein